MAQSFEFKVELPDGSVATRRTGTRLYQYVVAVKSDRGWGGWTWSGTKAAAQKAAGDYRRRYPEVQVLPVPKEQVEAALATAPHLSVESLQSKSRREGAERFVRTGRRY